MSDLPAGRELDALVAERVFGCALLLHPRPGPLRICGCSMVPHGDVHSMGIVKPYSTDIAAAWEVVGHIQASKKTDGFELSHVNIWEVTVRGEIVVVEQADTAPLAICRAALAWAEAKK